MSKEETKQASRIGRNNLLIPSQILKVRALGTVMGLSASTKTDADAQQETMREPPQQHKKQNQKQQYGDCHEKRSRRNRRRPTRKKKKKQFVEDLDGLQQKQQVEFPSTGNLPDPWYRAVSIDHLRLHPKFRPLPERVEKLTNLEDVSQFRQGSWQWDALHAGRCTTSQAAAALGFLEPLASQMLGIPPSWRKGGRGAYHRLAKPGLRALQDMKCLLLDNAVAQTTANPIGAEKDRLWVPLTASSNATFVADYIYQPNTEEYVGRKKYIKERAGGDYLENGIRLIWGTTQEATALLTALNYFSTTIDPNVVLVESGLCGAGLDINQTNAESSLLIGATPDGVLQYGDGRIEVVEVKNHCPFFSNKGRKRRAGKVKSFSIGDRLLIPDQGIPAQYVSQLQLEMYCLGPTCQSGVMIRQTATRGAVILRMHRDKDWIQEMLYFLHRFQREFVEANKPPPEDFFWNDANPTYQSRFRRFVNRTAQLANQVEMVAHIDNDRIQRVNGDAPFFLD